MICQSINRFAVISITKTTILLWLSVVFFFALFHTGVSAQRRFSRTYPAGQNVKLQLLNRSGTVEVEGWNRPEIRISAYLEAPAANVVPLTKAGIIYINLVKDNEGRSDVGNVNFKVMVPRISNVDIETRIGNLSVTNVGGGFVRAYISSDGDITLTNIAAGVVHAKNGIGDIFFDGDIMPGGNYRFTSIKGSINLRIPYNSGFKLSATAPSTRNISLGSFANTSTRYGDGRNVVGIFGDGSATVTVMNQRGSIAFLQR